MQLTITMHLDNAAFQVDESEDNGPVSGLAVADTLRTVADSIADNDIHGGDAGPSGIVLQGTVRDANGNRVGTYQFTE